ncbi:flagellar protein FlgN [Paraferrimonas sp. SM1919]|uniref:flagellar protein FlgN n=1 Tax=Paraferrimonas sp. SM1919 TaxID=2662263 RepID=UPI0013D7F9CA|nr:flagellar protein FlgN [Paraferrimonas sp. SM1919]
MKILVNGVAKDKSDYQKLSQLLMQQREFMLNHDNAQLLQANQQQQDFLRQIKKRAAFRYQLLVSLGLEPNSEGISKLARKLPERLANHLLQQWRELELLLTTCKEANEVNGRILANQMESLALMLTPKATETYGEQRLAGFNG